MKTVLVTSVPPNKNFSGTLLTWHLCKNFNSETLAGFFIINKHHKHIQADFPNPGAYNFKTVIKSREMALRHKFIPKIISTPVSFLRESYRKYFEIPRLAKQVINFATEQKADKIWIILEGQVQIWLASALIKKGKIPVHAQVWDCPQWWIGANRLDFLSARSINKSYEFAVKHAHSFASASENMSDLYERKYSVPSLPLFGITPACGTPTSSVTKSSKKFIIGIAGQIYATSTYDLLIATLDSIYWSLDGREIEIRYWGSYHFPKPRTRIIRRGYVPQEQLCEDLRECDILYCPYWFDKRFSEVARTSFPSKLSTYFHSGVLVLFHGPTYSAPYVMLKKNKAAVCCSSTNIELIKFNLREAAFSNEREQILQSAKNLIEGALSEAQLHRNFRKFLNLGEAN